MGQFCNDAEIVCESTGGKDGNSGIYTLLSLPEPIGSIVDSFVLI
jgi:hypothetical protein